jgi:PAS domain-containing protein
MYQTLQEKESFRNALNLIPNGVIMINLLKMDIEFANKELFELVKSPKEREEAGGGGTP